MINIYTKSRILMVAAILLLPLVSMAENIVTPESKHAEDVWNSKFYQQPVEKLYDSRILVRMFLLSGASKSSAGPRDTAIADLLITYAGSYAVRDCISQEALYDRATVLKGKPLSDAEKKSVDDFSKKFQEKFKGSHPNASKFSFLVSIDASNLKDTIGGTDTVEDAFAEIAKQHGWECDVRLRDDLSLAEIKESLRCGLPLIVTPKIKEEKVNGIMKLLPSFSKDRKWYVCFGCYDEDGKTYLMLNEPAKTTIISGPPTITKEDRESTRPDVIEYELSKTRNVKLAKDIISDTNRKLSSFGFNFEPYEVGKYSYLIVENWRQTSNSLDKELCAILKVTLPSQPAPLTLPVTSSPEQLWQYYFYQHGRHIGSPANMVNTVVIPTGKEFSPLMATLCSNALSKNYTLGDFVLTTSMLLQQSYRNGELRVPTQGELDKLAVISKDLEKQYDAMLAPIQKELATFAVSEIPDKTMEEKFKKEFQLRQKKWRIADAGRTYEDYNEVMFSSLKIKALYGNADTLSKMLDNLGKRSGWYAIYETKQDAPWEDYQAAIQSRIPIMLQSTKNKDQWKLGVGYLRHNNTNLLLTVDPAKIGDKMIFINPQQPFPAQGVTFEPFNAQEYTPYFVHHWEASARAYRDEVWKICPDTPYRDRKMQKNLSAAVELQQKLGIEGGSDLPYDSSNKKIFETGVIKELGGLTLVPNTNVSKEMCFYPINYYLKNTEGKKWQGAFSIGFADSEKNARLLLSQRILYHADLFPVGTYKIWKEGPGEICLVSNQFDETTRKYPPDSNRFYLFIRSGMLVEMNHLNNQNSTDIQPLAYELDKLLVNNLKKSSK